MELLLQLILPFLFGVIIGSFLNVVALRFNTGVGLGGRSKCMSCGSVLTWKELVPLFSFVVQKGSCKKCKSKISWQYPVVEFLAGVFFVLIFLFYPPLTIAGAVTTVIYLLSACLLLVMTIYDIKHKILPDPLVYGFAALSLLSLFVGGSTLFHVPDMWQLLAGPLLALPFALLGWLSNQTWMGLGDAKLVVGIGWLLGIFAGINALILAFWIAAALSVIWLFVTYKKFKPRTEIPFGPYLILGMYLVLLFHVQVLDLSILVNIFAGN